MEIIKVDEARLSEAGRIHALSWQASHRVFCTAEFVARHDVARQTAYLRAEIKAGKTLYMLVDAVPVGIVSVWVNVIENLYVLPERQGRGYGTALLRYAMAHCEGVPTLWVLDNNTRAIAWYERVCFARTGTTHCLSPTLTELEMAYQGRKQNI